MSWSSLWQLISCLFCALPFHLLKINDVDNMYLVLQQIQDSAVLSSNLFCDIEECPLKLMFVTWCFTVGIMCDLGTVVSVLLYKMEMG